MTLNLQPEMIQAIELAKSGKKNEAAQLLSQILKQQPENEAAWLWLASCLKTNQQKIYCLNQALVINPENLTTQKAIQKIKESEKKPAEETDPPRTTDARPKSINIPVQTAHPVQKKRSFIPWIIVFFVIVGIFLIFLLQPGTPTQTSIPLPDGLYLSNMDTGYYNDEQSYYLLRFCSDGTVMGATVLGTADQIGDMWPVFVYQNNFTLEHKEDFPFGQVQLGHETSDGTLINFTLEYKYPGHPDYEQRLYTGYINENETYLSECSADKINCVNRFYERVDLVTETP
jgi:hypothetical protein